MRNVTLIFLLMMSCLPGYTQRILAEWKFEKEDVSLKTIRKGSQLVQGYEGKGLRTDGYSTYIQKDLDVAADSIYLSGWFALESYPTDTAGFFALTDTLSGSYLSACIDRFGQPLIGMGRGEKREYTGGEYRVEKFRWVHVKLECSGSNIALFINGNKVASVNAANNSASYNRILIGRDVRDKFVNIFPVTFINGIVDEVHLSSQPLQNKKATTNASPDLAVPKDWFAGDFSRPKYHLLPAANWTNETHGLIYHKGKYHLFNQKNATNVFLGQINWGHFSSDDLVNWTEHIPALTPDTVYDERGAWSGHVVIENDTPVIMYTGGGRDHFNMCLAYPADDRLLRWRKYEGNPVVEGPPPGSSRLDPHDPYLWKEGNTWYMIVGFGVIENGKKKGSALLYKSADLKNWQYLHPFYTGDPDADGSGDFWEMPVVWKMNGKYIFLVNKVPSPQGPAVALYWIGDFIDEKFVPDQLVPAKLEVINRLLSPAVEKDKNGLTTAIAIIPDETTAEAQYQQGWTHLYSIPRVWKLENNRISQTPHPALKMLRGKRRTIQRQKAENGRNLLLSSGRQQAEIILTLRPGTAKKFGLVLNADANGKEKSLVYYDAENKEMVVDQSQSTQRKNIPLNIKKEKYSMDDQQEVKLHVFIDGSVVEIFINDRDAMTTRIFPASAQSDRVELFCEGGSIELVNGEMYNIKPASICPEFRAHTE